MEKISIYVLTFLLNAAWQIAVITLVATICARLMRRAPARQQHRIWTAALFLSVGLPVWSSFSFSTDNARAILPIPVNRIETQAITTAVSENITIFNDSSPRREQFAESNQLPWFVWFVIGSYGLFLLYRIILLCAARKRAVKIRRSASGRTLPPDVTAIVARCQTALQSNRVEILFSPLIKSPAMVGWKKPAVILPENFFDACSDELLTATFGHEMAHVKRGDYALNFVYELVFLPVAFHPAAAYLKRQIARTREMACDELVGERLLEPKVYAKSLLRLAAFAKNTNSSSAHALGIFDADALEQRVVKLIEMDRRAGARAGKIMSGAALLLLVATSVAASAFSFHPRTDFASARSETKTNVATSQTDIAKHIRALGSGDPIARAVAARELGKLRAVEAIPYLIELLGDDASVNSLESLSVGRWRPKFDRFKNPSPGEEAALALASIGEQSLEPLAAVLKDADSNRRRNAAWAIGELRGGPAVDRTNAVEALIALLLDAEAGGRKAAAFALSEARDERAVEPLISALADTDAGVREMTAFALGELKNRRASAALTVSLSDADERVRSAAKKALAEINDQ